MDVYILSAQRTPIGSFQGALSQVPATQLGATSLKAAVARAGLEPTQIDACIMGQVLTAGCGQAPARQAALGAGLPVRTECTTINKVCGSGLKALMLATDGLRLKEYALVAAGGQENMSQAPHLLLNARSGYRMGEVKAPDSMILDGLWCPTHHWHMGVAGEKCAAQYKFSRAEQDEFAKASYERALDAQKKGAFADEITSQSILSRKQQIEVTEDEEPAKVKFDKITLLRPVFDKQGSITAANASKINDGAAACVLASGEAVKKLQLKPMARVVSYATYAQAPEWFTTAPTKAVQKALQRAGLKVEDIDVWEINEAFSCVTMAAIKELGLEHRRVNPRGGAVALGHPIGASGARIMTTLLHNLQQHQFKYGVASLCLGGGEAVAMVIENL